MMKHVTEENLIQSVSIVKTECCRAERLTVNPATLVLHPLRMIAQIFLSSFDYLSTPAGAIVSVLHFVHFGGRALRLPSEVAHGTLRGAILEAD